MQFYLSTVGDLGCDCPADQLNKLDSVCLAKENNMGLELAEFCIADNLDIDYVSTIHMLKKKTEGISDIIVHGPFMDLYPSAVDRKVRNITMERFVQAYHAAKEMGAKKLILHSGSLPSVYFEDYHADTSVNFWKEFLENVDGTLEICMENVLDSNPELFTSIANKVNQSNFKLTLDIGHANCYSRVPVSQWLQITAPYLSHIHLHNNYGDKDRHLHPAEGTIDIDELLNHLSNKAPHVTITIENNVLKQSVCWLKEHGHL